MSQSRRAPPTRRLPDEPNLNQLKKQAKDLLKAFRAGESSAIDEVSAHYRQPIPGSEKGVFQLSDAQLVIARAYGFASWPKLKAFVDGASMSRFVAAVGSRDIEGVRAMLRRRPELVHMDTAGNNEHRALHYAVLRRDTRMVRLLMRAGANARIGIFPHRDATTAFALARDRDYKDIVAVIEEEEQHRREQMSCPNAAVSPIQDQINEAIHRGESAAAIRLLEEDKSLIHACDREGATPLDVASQATNEELVAWLLARGANARKRDVHGFAPLDRAALAAGPGNDGAKRFPAVARLLLDRGAEVTVYAAIALADGQRVRELVSADPAVLREIHRSRGGLVSLAVRHGHLDMVRLLLNLGADVDERTVLHELDEPTPSWGPPLWHAAFTRRSDIAEFLLDRGADPNGNVYASGWPLDHAYAYKDESLKQLLVERGAKPQPWTVTVAHDTVAAQRMLEADTSEELASELTWSAACNRCPAIVELALPRLDWLAQDPRWHWILIQPIRGLGDDNRDHEAFFTCMAMLLERGIDVNVSSRFGETALHFLAARGQIEKEAERTRFAAMLLDAGAKLNPRDDLLRSTPLGWACRWGREELVELLLG